MRSTAWQDFGARTYLRMVGLAGYKEILGTEEIVEYVDIHIYIYGTVRILYACIYFYTTFIKWLNRSNMVVLVVFMIHY